MVIRLVLFILLNALVLISSCNANENLYSEIKYYTSGVELSSSAIEVWNRELITIDLKVFTTEEFSYFEETDISINGFLIERKIIEPPATNGNSKFNKTLRLYIWTLNTGNIQLKLPDEKLWLSGRIMKTFTFPLLNITVKPLPDYLPPNFPVGIIQHASNYKTNTLLPPFLRPGELSNFELITMTSGLHPSMIPDYSKHLSGSNLSRLSVSETRTKKQYDIIYSYSIYQTIPVISNSNGISQFRNLKGLYFSPVDEKINSYQYNSAKLLILNLFFQTILVILILTLLLLTFIKSLHLIENIINRRNIWKSVYHSNTIHDLSISLRKLQARPLFFNKKGYTEKNTSLSQWACSWNDSVLNEVIEDLLCLQFSGSSSLKFNQGKQKIINRLHKLDNLVFYINIKETKAR